MRLPSIHEALAEASRRLEQEGVLHPFWDALLLLCDVTHLDKAILLGHQERLLSFGENQAFALLIARRLAREPLQYIRGKQEFWGRPIEVGPGCLIPRPETEHLVESALCCIKEAESPRVLEVGTGSGCVIAALASERPDGIFFGVDVDEKALEWTRQNTAALPNVRLARCDVNAPCPFRRLDLIVSNPPYITQDEWLELMPEVRDYEPRAALLLEEGDPLKPYRALARWAEASLEPGGHLAAEIGTAQAKRAAALRALSPLLEWQHGTRDLAGHLRVALWRRNNVTR
jgi:release factor glutamine methyltransferase